MMLAQLVLIPLLLLFTWGYLALRPANRRGTCMFLFDGLVIGIGGVLSFAAGWFVAGVETVPNSSVWVTVMSTVTTFHVYPAVLLAGWHFRRRLFASS